MRRMSGRVVKSERWGTLELMKVKAREAGETK